MASRRAGPETLGGGASTPRFLARLSAHAASLVCIASHASSTYGSSCSASAPPSAAIACVFASSTDISSSPSARSSDVSVYLAKASHAPPSAAKSERGQAAARSSFVTAARSSAPARCAAARCRAAFAAATARVVAAATGTALSRRRDTRDMRTGDGFRKLSAFEGDIFAVSFAFASSSSARATTGLIGRRRTPLRSASRRGWKHMGHFAGSPSARLVTACLATHGKQNAWPHSVTCGAVIRSSRHTGQRSGSAAPNSTSTTSSQSTMWSGSRLLPARSAQSATRNRKLACRKSSLECAPRRAREDGCAATAAATAAVPTAAVPTADERTTPARRLGLARGRAEVQQEIRAHALAAAARRRRVGRSGTWRRRVSIARREIARGGGRTLTRARAGRAGAAATRAHVASTAVASAVTAAAAPCASAPAWPAPRLAARGDASPRVRGRRGRRASGRRGERRGVEVQPADSPSGVVRHGDAPRIDPRASTDAPHADVAGKPRGYYDAKGEVTSLRVGTSEHRYHV